MGYAHPNNTCKQFFFDFWIFLVARVVIGGDEHPRTGDGRRLRIGPDNARHQGEHPEVDAPQLAPVRRLNG